MKIKDGIFRFKQFSVSHKRSSIKVGVDGVLIGAWGSTEGLCGLDIGCGCGLIALMAAQRNPEAHITALDIHSESVDEAALNFCASPWADRLEAMEEDVISFSQNDDNRERFDFILSNPPFFNAGLTDPSTAREKARHEGNLSAAVLLEIGERLLKEGGTLSMIMPVETFCHLGSHGAMRLARKCTVANKPSAKPKRVMATWEKNGEGHPLETTLLIRDKNCEYSPEYRELTEEFYLW